jgi:hypothetical protein
VSLLPSSLSSWFRCMLGLLTSISNRHAANSVPHCRAQVRGERGHAARASAQDTHLALEHSHRKSSHREQVVHYPNGLRVDDQTDQEVIQEVGETELHAARLRWESRSGERRDGTALCASARACAAVFAIPMVLSGSSAGMASAMAASACAMDTTRLPKSALRRGHNRKRTTRKTMVQAPMAQPSLAMTSPCTLSIELRARAGL